MLFDTGGNKDIYNTKTRKERIKGVYLNMPIQNVCYKTTPN